MLDNLVYPIFSQLGPLSWVRERAPWRHGDLFLLSLCLAPADRLDLGPPGEATITHSMLALEGIRAEQQRRAAARLLGGCRASNLESGRGYAARPNAHPDLVLRCQGPCACRGRLVDAKGTARTANAWGHCCNRHGGANQAKRYPRLCWARPEMRGLLTGQDPVWISPTGTAPQGWLGKGPAALTSRTTPTPTRERCSFAPAIASGALRWPATTAGPCLG
jgi:hypothetical protein